MAWSSHGVTGAGPMPALAGQTKGGLLLVCGAGRTLWEDRQAAFALGLGARQTLCVNFAGCFWPSPFQHWASLHAEHLPHWMAIRRRDYTAPHIVTHGPGDSGESAEARWDFDLTPGCSGLFAVLVALAMGFDRIVLAGMPETDDGHFYDPPQGYPGSRGTYMGGDGDQLGVWKAARDRVFAGRVTSLSGNTREILGAPQ